MSSSDRDKIRQALTEGLPDKALAAACVTRAAASTPGKVPAGQQQAADAGWAVPASPAGAQHAELSCLSRTSASPLTT